MGGGGVFTEALVPAIEAPDVMRLNLCCEFVCPISFGFCNDSGEADARALHEVIGGDLLGGGRETCASAGGRMGGVAWTTR